MPKTPPPIKPPPIKKKRATKKTTSKGPVVKKTTSPAEADVKESADKNKVMTVKKTGVRFPIVALGASAGGLEAFEIFFKAMNTDSGMAFILIAHLDPSHASLLPELLQKRTKMQVHQVKDGMKVQRNNVYVIPPNKNLTI